MCTGTLALFDLTFQDSPPKSLGRRPWWIECFSDKLVQRRLRRLRPLWGEAHVLADNSFDCFGGLAFPILDECFYDGVAGSTFAGPVDELLDDRVRMFLCRQFISPHVRYRLNCFSIESCTANASNSFRILLATSCVDFPELLIESDRFSSVWFTSSLRSVRRSLSCFKWMLNSVNEGIVSALSFVIGAAEAVMLAPTCWRSVTSAIAAATCSLMGRLCLVEE